jgi:beta-aspartyl-peptidase (threonine type)
MRPDPIEPVLVVHGGAGTIPDDAVDAHVAGVRVALEAGWRILDRGGSAVEAVEAAIVAMEDDETFDAGRGSFLNRDGRVQLDAMIMNGATLAAGCLAAVETVRNPILVARAIMERSPQVYLVGAGAERFALEQGFEALDNSDLVVERERRRFEDARGQAASTTFGVDTVADGPVHGDTVGAVALDRHGDLAAGTSTGGIVYKPVGRVGDSSIVGSGGYADNDGAAVSCTGEGEAIMRLVLGKWAVDRVADGRSPQEAAEAAIARLGHRLAGRGGMILLDRRGRPGIAFNSARMAWGLRTAATLVASAGQPGEGNDR